MVKEESPLIGRFSAKGNFDKNFKLQIIREVQAGKSRQSASLEYGIKLTTLKGWLAANRKGTVPPSQQRPVPAQFKRSVVRAVLSGRMTIQEAQSSFGIKGLKTITGWIEQSDQENAEIAESMKKGKKDNKATMGNNNELKALQQQLADAQLKIAALNTLIDVAEEQLNINIRKKPGAKQSSN
jgi:transposase-like protein